MLRSLRRFLLAASPGLLLALLASCGGSDSTGPDPNAVAEVVISSVGGATIVPLNGSVQLQASALNTDGQAVHGQSITWNSLNGSVAQVSQTGLVTGVGVGSAQIRASAGGRSAQIGVTVEDQSPPAAPSGLQGTVVSNTEIDLDWTDNSVNEQSFRIERESAGPAAPGEDGPLLVFSEVATVGAGVTSFSDTGLDPSHRFRYRVRACNAHGCSAFTPDIERTTFPTLLIETAALPGGTQGVAYAAMLIATGGSGDPAWSLVGGTLPPGLVLSPAGAISGTPTATGSFQFTVRAQGGGQSVERELQIEVAEDILPPVVTTTSLPDGTVGSTYDATLSASQGDGSYEWGLGSGDLPPGLLISGATGTISGEPTAAGTFVFIVEVTSAGLTGTRELSITVDFPPVTITTSSLPDGTVGVAYGAALAATGGDGENYTWTLIGGEPPPGVGLSAGGVLSGTPGLAGSFGLTLRVSSGGRTDERAFTIEIAAGAVTITTSSLPGGTVGAAYSQTLSATGGDGTGFAWSVTEGSLPTNLSLAGATGVISGTPTQTGTFDFTVRAESGAQTGERELSIVIGAGAPVAFENWYLPVAFPGSAYSYTIEASGGDGASYEFSVEAGALPTGLHLAPSTGVISGTSSASGTAFFTVEVSSGGQSATRNFALSVSTVGQAGFNIAILNAGEVMPSAALRTALDDAVAKWEAIVTTDFPPFTMPAALPDHLCQGHGPKLQVGETIEDLAILFDAQSIDGPSGTLARAGPCGFFLGSPGLFRAGSLVVDSDDLGSLSTTQLLGMMIHEMGHVVGVGALWDFDGRALIVDKGGADPRFVGAAGVTAYTDNLGGVDDDIPVENTGGAGTRDSHWRNAVFGHEVMTSFVSAPGVVMPVSIMTIQSVADLGYSVNAGAADTYSIPSPTPPGAPGPGTMYLHDDLVIESYLRIFPDGTILLVHPPG